MERRGTLLLKQKDVAALLDIDDCMIAVEQAFKSHAEGKMLPPKVLGMHSKKGGFHIKAGLSGDEKGYFVAKVNANFPCNPKDYGLPTIQGVIVVFEGQSGMLLAIVDSVEITILRTGAATGVAANYLALRWAKVATICGCGNQGKISLKSLIKVRSLEKVFAFDIDKRISENFSREFDGDVEVMAIEKADLAKYVGQSQIVVTCTPAKEPFIRAGDVAPGTFIAAVGSDSEEKQELYTDLVGTSKIVADIAEQSAAIGEVHHAVEEGKMTIDDIHAELGMIIAGKKPGRESDKEIIIFDSTGTALQDVAATSIVYEKATEREVATVHFSERQVNDQALRNLKTQRAIKVLNFWKPFR